MQAVAPGDIVLTPNADDLYVGIVEGGVEFRDGAVPHPWRRPVEWANPTEPISRKSISPSLYLKLRTLLTVTDLSEDLRELERLVAPVPKTA